MIPALKEGHEVVVGWDRPMRTFFAQVTDPTREEEDQILCWAGGLFDEHKSVDGLAAAIAEYAEIDEATRDLLNLDKVLGH